METNNEEKIKRKAMYDINTKNLIFRAVNIKQMGKAYLATSNQCLGHFMEQH